jgi:large subunit ribosomal protein L14e
MMEIGLVCVKIAGRDARKKCVIIDIVDGKHVLIDGETRRRKCNMLHLEPLGKKLNIAKGADTKAVAVAFKELGIEIKETKKKEITARPRKVRKSATKEKVPKKEAKQKTDKKTEQKE